MARVTLINRLGILSHQIYISLPSTSAMPYTIEPDTSRSRLVNHEEPPNPTGQGRCFLYLIPSHTFNGPWSTVEERTHAQVLYRLNQVQSVWREAISGQDEFGLLHPIHGIDTYSLIPDTLPEIDFSRNIRGVPYSDAFFAVLFHGLDHCKLNRNVGKIQFRFLIEPTHERLRDILEKAASQTRIPINSQPLRSLAQLVTCEDITKPL